MPSRQWGGQAVEVGGRRGGRAGAKRARRRQSPTGLGPPPPCSLLLLSRPPPRARAGASPRAIAATPPRPGPRASPGRRRWGECGSPRHRPAFRSARDPHSQIAPLSVRRRQAARRESAPSPLATRTRTSLSLSLSQSRCGRGMDTSLGTSTQALSQRRTGPVVVVPVCREKAKARVSGVLGSLPMARLTRSFSQETHGTGPPGARPLLQSPHHAGPDSIRSTSPRPPRRLAGPPGGRAPASPAQPAPPAPAGPGCPPSAPRPPRPARVRRTLRQYRVTGEGYAEKCGIGGGA